MNSSTESRVSLRDRFKAATRDAILDAAAGLLTSDDAAHVRMEDIAARAGIAVGTLYNYFQDRGALVAALLEARSRALLDALDAVAAGADDAGASGFEADLQRFVSAVSDHFDRNRFLLHVLFQEDRSRGIDARSATRRQSALAELFVRADRLMARGIRVKALRKGDPQVYASLLVGMIRGVLMRLMAGGGGSAPDAGREIVRVFMTGAAR